MPEQTPGSFWVIEHLMQNIGRLFTSEDSEKNAAAENGIDETGGIPGKQPAITGESLAPIGKIRCGIDLRNAPTSADAIAHEGLLGNRALEKFFGGKSRAFEVRCLQYNADTGAVIFQGDDPEPALQGTNHAGERAIDSLLAFQPLVVRKERKLLQMLITFLQLELTSDHGISPARVDQILSPEFVSEFSVAGVADPARVMSVDTQSHTILIEVDTLHRGLLTHFRARFRRVIQQHLVEFRSCYLIRTVGARAESILEVKLRRFFSTGLRDLAPKFFDKAGAQLFTNPQPGKCFHAKRQKRLTDVKTRKLVAFEHNHASPRFAEQDRRGAAGGAAADNRNIIIFHREKVADFAAKQSPGRDVRARRFWRPGRARVSPKQSFEKSAMRRCMRYPEHGRDSANDLLPDSEN